MRGRITSVICVAGLLWFFGGASGWLAAQASDIESEQCVVDPAVSYFTPILSTSTQTSELCFVRPSEIQSFDRFVIVDTSAQSPLQNSALHTISLPDWQIKTKFFLKNKPILIVAEPYKRYALAKLCRELIQSGFQSPKILIDNDFRGAGKDLSADVPVEEFIVETSKFGAVTIAVDRQVAEEMAALGIPTINAGSAGGIKSAVREAEVNHSLNGYLPVFVVGKSGSEEELQNLLNGEPVSQAFVVSGGVESIKRVLKSSALSANKRLHPNGVSICAG
ncbi:hypothetical protein [Microbulbifer hainanensis]|uniref:hypothetical protein n=1 Tax=Microbulbifer hainanensis TaxID=2735675 RepID=UPI0018685F51|nr:hypothetical protein [Microbulbifer hainanensis]